MTHNAAHKPRFTRSSAASLSMSAFLFGISLLVSGCNNARQGAVSGAGIGALSGLAIGSLTGEAGKGAAAGAIIGGVGGAVIGDQNRRASRGAPGKAAAPAGTPAGTPATAATPPPLTRADQDRLALAKFARSWKVTGWEVTGEGRRNVVGTARGSVENNYFVRLDMRVAAEGQPDAVSTGNIILGSEPERGVAMTSRYSTTPVPLSYVGRVADNGNTFTFDETLNTRTARHRIVIRFLSADEFVADVTVANGTGSVPQASFRFTGDY